MTAVTVPFRLKPADLAYQGSFQCEHQARVDRPLDDLDLNEFLRDVQANLRPGDEVKVVAYRDRKWEQVMEVGRCIVTSKRQETVGGPSMIRAVWLGEPIRLPEAESPLAFKVAVQKLIVKKEFSGGFTVQDDKGHVIESFKTKAEANDYIARLNEPDKPKEEPKAA